MKQFKSKMKASKKMGEYAKINGIEVKIGTCETMYYLRFDDIKRMTYIPNNVNFLVKKDLENTRFRIPLPSEDGILPGHYDSNIIQNIDLDWIKLKKIDLKLNSGRYFYSNGLGQNFMGECYHALPHENARYNGLQNHLVLRYVKYMDGKLYPVIGCKCCSEEWRISWEVVLESISLNGIESGQKLIDRLLKYSVYDHNNA